MGYFITTLQTILNDKILRKLVFLLFCSNMLLYGWMAMFHSLIPFDKFDYQINAHHYVTDNRINGGTFSLVRAIGQYDAQWYLKIANSGYPTHPRNMDVNDKATMDGLSYAFFP